MAISLKAPCAVLVVLRAFAVGDDILTCTSASSCGAWKDVVDGSATINVQEGNKAEDVQYYRIDVKCEKSGTSFSKLRRFREFVKLRNDLDLNDDNLPWPRIKLPPFPPKLVLNSIVQKLWPQTLEDRRAQLQAWLRAVVTHENSMGKWADELFAFLDPKETASASSSGIVMPPNANKICWTLTWPVTSDKHYFGIDVDNGSDMPNRVWRRYSDFHALNETLGRLGGKDEDFKVAFPGKLYWNNIISIGKWDGKLEERRRSLEVWLRQVKLHPNSASGGAWIEELNKFLDPTETEKLEKDCALKETAEATYTELEKLYSQMKDKIDELTKEKVDEPTELAPQSEEL